jgi:ectoine hydroxylase-related dioxygenase (phytanoyl-CoA dioxygenase family)
VFLERPDAYLFLDLFVVKPPREGAPFAWHQDGGYLLGRPHKRYVTLWCALDDMTVANGTLRVLRYAHAPTRDVVPHVKDRVSGDLIGYRGDEAGEVISVGKGGIVVLASDLFHCSGANVTDAPRRAYLASISPEPVCDHNGALWNLAVPILRHGLPVVRSEAIQLDALRG